MLCQSLDQWISGLNPKYLTQKSAALAEEEFEPIQPGEVLLGECPQVSRYLWVIMSGLTHDLSGKPQFEFDTMSLTVDVFESKFKIAMRLCFKGELEKLSRPFEIKLRKDWQVVYVLL